ncbi:phosphocholine cytidylyltransferase family protein [Desulfobacula sp.]|uniref:phosphocholine cytidylyltransferase family protein n=1 Tax=Desulfobacula sp. TaxID=2593537 RepID=UPI00260A7986|nr:phosphocholine cytidylyltransferase family protein [Desulfobacula sp.]
MRLNKNPYPQRRITTALLLAAGTGSRLFPLTQKSPKCLTLVNETSILERLIKSLNQHGFKRLVVVTGHLEDCIRNFLETRAGNIKIEYVFSPLYKTTNNIYSLWMAREIINEPFVLIESDLVFDPSLLTDMLYPDRIAIARMKPWLNGSTVTINPSNSVDAFHSDAKNNSEQTRYKTVNIYSLSVSSWYRVIEKLNLYILAGRVNDYYEAVFQQMVAERSLSFQAVFFDHKPWYEIDTIEDLAFAEKLFPTKTSKPLSVYDIEPDRLENTDLYPRKSFVEGSLYARS